MAASEHHDIMTHQNNLSVLFETVLSSAGVTKSAQIYLPLPRCAATCGLCLQHYRTSRPPDNSPQAYKGELSDVDAVSLVKDHAGELRLIQTYLQDLLRTHGDLILARWTKWNKDRRGKLLSETSPSVLGAWPPLASKFDEALAECRSTTWRLNDWLNITDLVGDKSKLLALLYGRATYSASTWAPYDTALLCLTFDLGKWPLYYNSNCVKMCGDDFGSMAAGGPELVHSFAYMGFPRALITLQFQLQAMQVLQSVVSAITDGAEGTGNSKWTSLVASGFKQSGTNMLYNPHTDKPFAVPTTFNPRDMLEKAQARLDLILDGIELMQTEPALMQSVLRSMRADINTGGNTIRPEIMWGKNCLSIMSDMINRINAWTGICGALRNVCEYFERRGIPISPGDVLDEATSRAMDALCSCLDHSMRFQGYVLDGILPGTRSLRDQYIASEWKGIIQFTKTVEGPGSGIKLLVDTIRESIFKSAIHDMSPVFKALLKELCDPRTSEPVDRRLYEQLSDLMLMNEFWLDYNYSQFTGNKYREELVEFLSYNKNGLSETTNKIMSQPGPDTIRRLGKAVKHFMESPWP